MKVLAVIPARGGSKGLPGKNIKPLNDKPLIAWSIESANASKLINKTIVSTDDSKIIDVAKKFGANIPFVRPEELSSDTATTKDVLIHALNELKNLDETYDYLVLLQPTTPFRKAGDIDKMIQIAQQSNSDMVVSVKETSSNPYYVLFEEDENGFLQKSKPSSFTRRQDCPTVYEYNGSIYVIKVSALMAKDSLSFDKTIKYLMDEFHSVDIDSQFDLDFAEFLLSKNN